MPSHLLRSPTRQFTSFGRGSAALPRLLCVMILAVFLLGVSLPSPFAPPSVVPGSDNRHVGSSAEKSRLAWLMAFPGSGTTSTMRLIQGLGRERVATNYGDDPRQFSPITGTPDPVRIDGNMHFGPFWCRFDDTTDGWEELPIPAKWIVTTTHCGGYCNTCGINEYIQSPQSFLTSCATAQWYDFNAVGPSGTNSDSNSGSRPTSLRKESYPTSRVGKTIHLIRNPFVNVVSRFHAHELLRLQQKATSHRGLLKNVTRAYSTDRAGFRSFCQTADEVAIREERHSHNINQDILRLVEDVPCHVDLFRWIEWHNQAFFVSDFLLQVRSHVVHYETLTEERTRQNLLAFLELNDEGRIGATTTNVDAKLHADSKQDYQDYFASEEREAMKQAAQQLASDTTWENIQHYF